MSVNAYLRLVHFLSFSTTVVLGLRFAVSFLTYLPVIALRAFPLEAIVIPPSVALILAGLAP